MYVDYVHFSQSTYEVFEDERAICIELTLDKPALFNATVRIDESEVSNGG